MNAINATLLLTTTLCPQYNLAKYLISLTSIKSLKFNSPPQLATYACDLGDTVTLIATLDYYGGVCKFVAFFIGLLGAILALCTFSRSEYSNCITIIYHKTINSVEIFNAFLILQGAIHTLYGARLLQYEAWAFFVAHIVDKVQNCTFFFVNTIAFWIAIERVLACVFHKQFIFVNRKIFAIFLIASFFIFSVTTMLPYGFVADYSYNNSTQKYDIVPSQWKKNNDSYQIYSTFFAIISVLHSILLFVASTSAVVALIYATKRKKFFINATTIQGRETGAASELMRQCVLNSQLCVIQICETIPCTGNEILLAYILIRYEYVSVPQPIDIAPLKMEFGDAMENLGNMKWYLSLHFVNVVATLVSHFFRFYWYVIFSHKTRKSFISFLKRRNEVVPSG